MLKYIIGFGPLLCVYAAFITAVVVANRTHAPWLMRYRNWLKSLSSFQQSLNEAVFYSCGVLLFGALVLPAARLQIAGIPGLAWWLPVSAIAGVFMVILRLMFPPYKEPEDWLLWRKKD